MKSTTHLQPVHTTNAQTVAVNKLRWQATKIAREILADEKMPTEERLIELVLKHL